jgi:hypothetical protein
MQKKEQVVVSLTSFPSAISFAVQAVKSILEGTVMPDRIILYLTASQFPDGKIPSELIELKKNKLFEVRFYEENIRSYTKLIPALKDFPNDIIVTIDDDVWYDKDMLRVLLRLHDKFPDAILAHRAKKIKLNAPYRKWKKYRWYHFVFKRIHSSYRNLQTGVGGVLYPPHSLKKEMIDSELFKAIAPTTDDIWFWAAAVANGTKIIPVPFGYNKPRGLKKPKGLSLKTTNFKSGIDLNSESLKKILKKYPEILQKIESEN